MAYVKTRDGTHLFTKDWGSGRPVVLIHGWPLTADSFDDTAVALADNGYRAISYDRRGFGRSDQPYGGYDYDTFADDLADVMKECGVEDAALVGFSMGGGEVARYLSRHGGNSIAKAVLVSSIVPLVKKTDDNPDGVDQSMFDDIAKQIRADRGKFMSTFLDQFYGVGMISQPVSDEVLDQSWNQAMMAGLHPTLTAAKAWSSTDFRPDLAAFTMPTLIIHGTSDKNVPIDATGRAAAKAIPHAELIEYDGAPHGVLATQKDRFNNDLLNFLGGDNRDTDNPQTVQAEPTPNPATLQPNY